MKRLGAIVAVLALAAGGWLAYTSVRGSSTDAIRQAALQQAQQTMVWAHGPTVQSVQIVPLRSLPQALAPLALRVRNNVNVSDLVHHYGPDKRVAVVILRGTYNSLPPDEGMEITGQVIVLVDVATTRVIFLTD